MHALFSADTFTEADHPALLYQAMLGDWVRMDSYRRAIRSVVKPGDVVADLGTGLGVLALMAVQAGARKVYAIDTRERSLWIADRVVRANGGENHVSLVLGDARTITIPEQVDVIVNELIGDFGTDEGIFECVSEFARRYLKPGGNIVPNRLKTFLVPVEYRDEFRGVWREDFHGLDLRTAIALPCRPQPVMYGLREQPKELAVAYPLEDIVFGHEMGKRDLTIPARFEVLEKGNLQGFVGYFDATLVPGLGIRNYPCYAGCHWLNWNWPVSPPIPVHPGQRIEAQIKATPNMVAAGWTMDFEVIA